jgi:hypothetical protein
LEQVADTKPTFVVSTHSHFLYTDFETTIPVGSGYYTGTAVLPDGSVLTAKRVDPLSKESPTLFEHYSAYEPISRIYRDDIRNVHQIALWRSGIYVCNTFYKQLRWDPIDQPEQVSVVFDLDIDAQTYLNSVYPTKSGVWIVLRQNGTTNSDVIKLAHEAPFTALDSWKCQHTGVHNILEDDEGQIYYCASDAGKVVRRAENGESIFWDEIVTGGHVKGLCIHDGYLYAGVSEHAVSRERRFTADGKIAKINLTDWILEDMFSLRLQDGTVGNINDVFYLGERNLQIEYTPIEIIDKSVKA